MQFTRTIKRDVHFKSTSRGIPDADWVFELSASGLRARRKGRQDSVSATWRQILGFLLIHGAGAGRNGS